MMTLKRRYAQKSKGDHGIRQIKLLGLNDYLFCDEKYFESRNLELIDAVLQDIELGDESDESEGGQETSIPDAKSDNACKVDSNVISPTSVVLLKERTKRAQQITCIPFDGALENNMIAIEAQLKGALVAGRPLTCAVCESSDVKQNKQLTALSMWRKTLMSGLTVNGRSRYAKI